ncbi:trna n6-adenosine threonylcarbamoyltransferase [Holotrichia oblita]|uniref:Trna n6-adenosine threonylcarbamoyltransferase n=2 Tax=Holotrichia oblita TaxID=644536 RepID=A0ACB9TES7_HOLOL|nr:trna n6-adenosine threonylcarbamoyltransferase [Holotrichia oblita]KAI4465199.1 trna n6-adenosine threonylcarbamoyltransferase [Holotrichia oblita]
MYKLFNLQKLCWTNHLLHKSTASLGSIILGIETSCDDTGCAIVNDNGTVLGEALHSQHQVHLNHGGIIPPIAQTLHRQYIENIVETALLNANITVNDVDAIATTVKPGMHSYPVARRMKLKNIPEYSQVSGGQAIELAAAKSTDPLKYKFTIPLTQYRDCNFSMAGLKTQLLRHLIREEKAYNVAPDEVIPNVHDLSAGFLLVIARHLCHRVQRGMVFAERRGLITKDRKTLVVSGGAACNNFIAKALRAVCEELGYEFARPPPKLCTDNGVMIAWNGIEKWNTNIDIRYDYDSIATEKISPLGTNIVNDVVKENISCKWVKLNKLNDASAFK